MKKIRANGNQIKDVFASFGNQNIWGHYLKYFEQKIKELKEFDNSISDAPNYFAWISLASEYIAMNIRVYCFVHSELSNDKIFDEGYKSLIDQLSKFTELKNSETIRDSAIYFIKIRHLIVHKGFPNPYNVPSRKSRPISKNINFTKDDVWTIRNEIIEPKNFPLIYDKFRSIVKWLSINRKKLEIGF